MKGFDIENFPYCIAKSQQSGLILIDLKYDKTINLVNISQQNIPAQTNFGGATLV